MRSAASRALGGAAAAVAFCAVAAFPSELGAGVRPASASEDAAGLDALVDSGPAGLAERVDAQLEARIPQLEGLERRVLAQTIVAEAAAARIDPLLVLALIEVESAYDPGALSGRGARGLMQLREPTMRRELERHGFVFEDPHDPVANVRAGVRYLRRLLDAFGREDVALMAYNAGPNRILGYLRTGEIPQRFHAYPRRIRTELRRLRRSMGDEPAPAIAEARVPPAGQ
jgi:soluble lytic murein transglycosylase-like protein